MPSFAHHMISEQSFTIPLYLLSQEKRFLHSSGKNGWFAQHTVFILIKAQSPIEAHGANNGALLLPKRDIFVVRGV